MFKFLVLVALIWGVVYLWKLYKIVVEYIEGKGWTISYDVRKDGKFVRREQYIFRF